MDRFAKREAGNRLHDKIGYHYHATKSYPYVIGGFRGKVVEAGGQVDPQPRAQGMRPAQQPLRGAEITDFSGNSTRGYALEYQIYGKTGLVKYQITATGSDFKFISPEGVVRAESYQRRQDRSGKGRPKR